MRAAVLSVLFLAASGAAAAPGDVMNPTRFTLSFSEPQAHLVDVEMRVPDAGDALDLWMPTWTPGSYMVREYSRNVQELRAESADGRPLDVRKTAKNRWQVTGAGNGEAVIRYRVYGHEKTVRTNWIDADYALLNGAPTFLVAEGRETTPFRIRVDRPGHWARTVSPLPAEGDGDDAEYIARDLDTLVDSPLLVGNPAVYEFTVDDRPILLVNQGEGGLWDGEKAARDTETLVRACRDMYGSLPFDRYVFFNLIVEGRGGLEHKDSSVLMTSRYDFRDAEKYRNWLRLVAHEFFHVWNVKRSRPVELGPFDYVNEVYSRTLWVAEGITAYYEHLLPVRTGLYTRADYLKALDRSIQRLDRTPGRELQSIEESSFDAWIKLYRPDENTENTTVSYYLKGSVVAFLLDAEIRNRTGGERTLDDLMRLLFERYSGERGFTGAQVQQAAEEIAGGSLETFFETNVRGTGPLDYAPALRTLGLRFKANEDSVKTAWMGIESRGVDGRLTVGLVRAGSPAYEAGLNAEDEILAVGGFRVTPGELAERLKQYAPGDRVEVLVSRFGEVRVAPLTLGTAPRDRVLEVDPDAAPEAVAAREAWLGAGSPVPTR